MSLPNPRAIQEIPDLNTAPISGDSDRPLINQMDFSCEEGDAQVYFKDLRKRLIQHIRATDVVVGCVAWLTDHEILRAFSGKRAVSIIVQKEDFLRPDIGAAANFRSRLRTAYEALPHFGLLFSPDTQPSPIVFGTNTHGSRSIEPVRCVGHHNRAEHSAWPRMHHKFLVFCDVVESLPFESWRGGGFAESSILRPRAVWTGSYNFTENGSRSLENALYLDRPRIAAAYFREWGQIAALSESLDWTSDWLAPDRRIGS